MKQKRLLTMLVLLMTVVTGAMAEPIIVIWTSSDGSFDNRVSYSNGVTQEPVYEDEGGNPIYEWGLWRYGTFTTSLGHFTKIEISGGWVGFEASPGWDGRTWTGNASSVYMANRVTSDMGNNNFTITFTIVPWTDVTGLTLSQTEAAMTVGGDALTLTATVAPDNATDKTVTWTTSDANVATVTDGVVTAVAAGTATITATATNGTDDTSDDKTATCAVTVAAAPTGYSITLAEGTEDAGNWSVPTEAAEGSPVTVTYSGEKKVKSVKAVKKAATIPVTAITLNKTATTISAGNTETLSVTAVAPDNATDKTYTWKTSDASIATVDQDGKVTAVALGTVIIYAEANDGSGVKDNCTVTVSKVVTINLSDWGERGQRSFTKDGVTVSASMIDPLFGELGGDITISTTLGIFTKIVVTAEQCYASGTGWSGDESTRTWAGTPASTVSFRGEFEGRDSNPTTIVCTIVP